MSAIDVKILEARFWFRDTKKAVGRVVVTLKNDGAETKITGSTSPVAKTTHIVRVKTSGEAKSTNGQSDDNEIVNDMLLPAKKTIDLDATGYFLDLRDINPTIGAKNSAAKTIPVTIILPNNKSVNFQAKIVPNPMIPKVGDAYKGNKISKIVPVLEQPKKLIKTKSKIVSKFFASAITWLPPPHDYNNCPPLALRLSQ